ncbi:TPA: hypothetical protein DEP21_06475 [Patescibacteria group bacterium]|nr:hypothetical protein [Candidatus Gracilibacteria bacterium]
MKDEQLVDSKNKIKQDEYLDILVSPADSCKKYRRVFFNTPSDAHKSYDEVFDNIQERLNSYMDQGTQSGEDLITSVIPKTDSSAMDQCTEEAIDAKVNTLFSNNSYGSMSASLRFLSTLKPQFLFEKKIKKKIKSKIKSDCAKIAQQQTDDIKSQLSSIPGMSSIFESWNVSNLFSDSSLGNFSINSTALDNALLPVQQKMEELANKLCQ